MNRLLQGDVGAGKTLVALMALLIAVEAGGQGVMMAPTEILARQHLAGPAPAGRGAGVVLEILTGRDKGAERRAKLAALAAGDIQILVGTHAVFQKDVDFHDLRLAIVDEQHRFGVRQRLELGAKGAARRCAGDDRNADPALAVAGAIWRHGCARAGRKAAGAQADHHGAGQHGAHGRGGRQLRRAIAEGRQAYWVCPLVEESEAVDLTAPMSGSSACAPPWARASWGWCMARCRPRKRTPRWRRSSGRDHGSGGDHGDRGGGGCAQCLDHGDRAGREFRPGAACTSCAGASGGARRHRPVC